MYTTPNTCMVRSMIIFYKTETQTRLARVVFESADNYTVKTIFTENNVSWKVSKKDFVWSTETLREALQKI